MNFDYLLRLQAKLRSRYERVNTSDYRIFVLYLTHFMEFCSSESILQSVILSLSKKYPELASQVEEPLSGEYSPLSGEDFAEHAAICLFTLKRWAKSSEGNQWIKETMGLYEAEDFNEHLIHIKSLFLEPLYQYLNESLDDSSAALALLIRYKHRTEWYRRNDLYQDFNNETQKGERILADDLYLYLHDQGIDFIVEPHSVSGIPDLLLASSSLARIVADAKVFAPDKGKGKDYLARGFNQVYTYLKDYNEPFGYLVVFNVSGKDLTIDVSGSDFRIPYVAHNGKTIFIHVIDVFPYEQSASKRGKLEPIVLEESLLTTAIDEPVTSDNLNSEEESRITQE